MPAADSKTETFDGPLWMEDEVTTNLVTQLKMDQADAEKLGNVHRGLHALGSLTRLVRRFSVDRDEVIDGDIEGIIFVSRQMEHSLLCGIELLAEHLSNEAYDFSKVLEAKADVRDRAYLVSSSATRGEA